MARSWKHGNRPTSWLKAHRENSVRLDVERKSLTKVFLFGRKSFRDRPTMRIGFGLLVVCLCFTGFAFCQEQIPASPPTLKQRPPADHGLRLDVVVTNKTGHTVSNLSQGDFTVLDNKRSRALVSFQAVSGTNRSPDPGVQIIFVLDGTNDSVERVTYARQQLEKFLRQDNGRLSWPTLVILFTDTATRIEPAPTRDGNALAAMLESNPTGLRALRRSAADDRADISLDALSRMIQHVANLPGRKLMIWLSSGWPLLQSAYITESMERGIFGNIVDLTDELEKQRITLYTVDPLSVISSGGMRAFNYESFLKPVRSWDQAEYGNLSLQVLAVQSGGRVLNSGNDLTSEIANCLNDAKTYYTLVFNEASALHPDEYHNISVLVDKPGLKARTRLGYYAQPYQR